MPKPSSGKKVLMGFGRLSPIEDTYNASFMLAGNVSRIYGAYGIDALAEDIDESLEEFNSLQGQVSCAYAGEQDHF